MGVLFLPKKATASLSPPLPVTNRILNGAGLVFRRGQFSLMAAAPGVGKSVFATNLAVFTKAPTLFFSADSDEWTVTTRVCSILTGVPLEKVARQLNEPGENDYWHNWFGTILVKADHVDWSYNSRLDPDFMSHRIQAHTEMWGQPPHLIVVDNLKNTVDDMASQGAELESICYDLQETARMLNAHVLALHHVTGNKENGYEQIGLSDLLYKTGKVPEIVLGLNRVDRQTLNLNVAKNRGGPSGQSLSMSIDYTTATVGGFL